MNSFIIDQVREIVAGISTVIYNKYRNYVERSDIKQECWLWAMSRESYITEQLDTTLTPEEYERSKRRIGWQMLRAAERYARKEKAIKSGYQPNDEAYYETATIAQLLPFVISNILEGTILEQAQDILNDGMPKGTSTPSEGGNLLAALLDIKRAYLKLDENDSKILQYRYHLNLTLAQIGEALGCATSTADRRCDHALRALQDLLGGETPFK